MPACCAAEIGMGGASLTTTRVSAAMNVSASCAAAASAVASNADAAASVAGMSRSRLSCWMAPVSHGVSWISAGTSSVRSSSHREATV